MPGLTPAAPGAGGPSPPLLDDPSHIPSLLPRIAHLFSLIGAASAASSSSSVAPSSASAAGAGESTTPLTASTGSGLSSERRTELVRAADGLRGAFERARAAVEGMEGGDMSVEEQEKLISVLEDMKVRKRDVLAELASASLGSSTS